MKTFKINKEFVISTAAIIVGGFALGFYFYDQVEAKSQDVMTETVIEESNSDSYIPEQPPKAKTCEGGCGCGQ